MRLCSAFLFVALLTMSASAQTTYTWNQTGTADFGTASNWTPARTTPATNDVLIFDGGTTPSTVVTGVITQTVGELIIQNNANVTLVASSAATVTVSSTFGAAFQIGPGSSLIDSTNSAITITLPTGVSGQVDGTFRVRGATAATANKLTAH